ncbi:hypothetical protein [Micromonospora sp. CPCC 206061]|uniref:hypothetical protein n=1 Tax=Micromonospora sp. CPCC 206061 TaxID=3122410 RepID=UPI002FF28218
MSIACPAGRPSAAVRLERDGNQEDITNDAITSWSTVPCHRFECSDNPGGEHLSLASAPAVLGRLVDNLRRPKSAC